MSRWGWLLLGIAGLAVFGPAVPALSRAFLGIEYVDHYGTQWFYWYLSDAITHGKSLATSDLFFYPFGKDIFAHTGSNLLDAVAAWPFVTVFGTVLGYNLFVLAAIAWSAWCFSLLVRSYTDDPVAIAIGTGIGALSPYVLFELVEGRPTQAILGLGALFFRSFQRTLTRPGIADALLTGLWLGLLGYQYWFYAVFFGLAAVAGGLAHLTRAADRPATLARLAVGALMAVTLVAPVALPMVVSTAVDATSVPGLLDTDQWNLTATPPVTVEGITVGLFEWQPFRGTTGFQVQNPDGSEVFLQHASWGPVGLLLIVLLHLRFPGRLDRRVTLAMLVTAAVLAVGPVLLVGSLALPNPPYIALIKTVGFLKRLWWPARAFAVISVLIAPMVAVALAEVRARWTRRAFQGAAATVLVTHGVGLGVDKLVPFPTWDATVPAGYQCLAQGPEGAIIELPYSWTQAHLYYQTLHHRPIFGGMIENNAVFAPEAAVAFRESNTLIGALLATARLDTDDFPEVTDADRAAVYDLGYRYVVLQRDAFVIESVDDTLMDNAARTRMRRLERTLDRLLGKPVWGDARILIWAPWGDGAPCAPGSVTPDVRAEGRPDEDPASRMLKGPDEQKFERLFEP